MRWTTYVPPSVVSGRCFFTLRVAFMLYTVGVVVSVFPQALIGFVTALEDCKFGDAMARLEGLDLTPETEAMWAQVLDPALCRLLLTVCQCVLPRVEETAVLAARGCVLPARFPRVGAAPWVGVAVYAHVCPCLVRPLGGFFSRPQLHDIALSAGELSVAERCSAALGDVCRARFLHKTSKIAKKAADQLGGTGKDFWMVRARLAQVGCWPRCGVCRACALWSGPCVFTPRRAAAAVVCAGSG